MPTLSRLPGYPAFLAMIFALFGVDNFRAVLLVQVSVRSGDLFPDCRHGPAFVLRARGEGCISAGCALPISRELCRYGPHRDTGNIFHRSRARFGISCVEYRREHGQATLCALARLRAWRSVAPSCSAPTAEFCSLPWAAISLVAFEDSASRYAQPVHQRLTPHRNHFWPECSSPPALRAAHSVDPAQSSHPAPFPTSGSPLRQRFRRIVMPGFNRWVKTWMADYVSVQEIYWAVPGAEIDVTRLPRRAFDSDQQREQTSQLFADYNPAHDMTPELDARFAALAAERIHAAPLRYYAWLPAVRIADMWLRPRTELFPLRSALVGVQRRPSLAHRQPGLRRDESALRRSGARGTDPQPRIFRHRSIRFISTAPLRISRQLGESRAPLHPGMLSGVHRSCLRALSAACITFQIREHSLPHRRIQTFHIPLNPENSA